MTRIDGTVEPGFEAVRAAFERNFERHGEIGAACSVHVHGRKVVDLWGGVADRNEGRAWDEDTLVLVFSTTKGATAACANLLVQRGELDLRAPVAEYWPEFAKEGKENIPVEYLLTHQAGLPVLDERLTLEECLAWEPVIEALERQAPLWEPGTAHGYHAVSYGYLVGEVVRRVTGRTIGRFFAEEIAEPLGCEFFIGLPDEHQHRCATLVGQLVPPTEPTPEVNEELLALINSFVGPESLLGRALTLSGAFAEDGTWNRPDLRAAEVPAAGGVTNARSLSRFYAGLIGPLDGTPAPILTRETIDRARTQRTEGNDRMLFFETAIGLGFWVSSPFAPYGGAGGFGHGGAGGSVGFADPENGIAFGYVMNQMLQNLSGDPRSRGLIRAVYDAAGAEAVNV